jgi:hexosaminidase
MPPIKNSSRLASVNLAILFLIVSFTANAQFHIIPEPVKITALKGSFTLKDNAIIGVDAASEPTGVYLQNYLAEYYGLHLQVKTTPSKAAIRLIAADNTKKGAYTLVATSKEIEIHGNADGLFYGVQSLIQLLPATGPAPLRVPACEIADEPRFGWRGLSMDVSRHFFTVDEVKKYIDMMAHYKLNMFHWHLTDDEGWRIQIDKYPLLTEIASNITMYSKEGKYRPLDNLVDSGGRGGFYTKDDVRGIIKYAADRHITILPEIEMPGHSEEAIFAYPELGCKDSTNSHRRTRMLDPSEYTFNFYENVLSEVIDLFPGQYVHIGGDEAEMNDWLKSPTAVALMKREHFTDVRQIQSYFIRRIETFLTSKNRKMIGWDEILKGGLAPSATVMSWEGESGGILAAKMHHNVVMTPLPQMYFDAPQANAANEPIGWNDPVSWQMVYNYEPQPAVLTHEEAGYILGAQANIWTEKIANMKHLEYMIYPRLLAESELNWTPKDEKNIRRFEQSMYAHYALFNLWNLNARLPDVLGLESVATNKDVYEQTITYPLTGAHIQYTTTKKLPDANSAAIDFPIFLKSPVKDSIKFAAYVTRPLSDRILQTATVRRINVNPETTGIGELHPGLGYTRYKTMQNNTPALDTSKTFEEGIFNLNEPVKPFPGDFNTWVKIYGYVKIETEGDYRLTSGFENSPLLILGKEVVITYNRNKYVEPQAAILHLQKGIYRISGYYLADNENSEQMLIELKKADGKTVEPSAYLYH